ncbi:hypothetical protein ACE38W_00450 [Chitinophaga sp. Hz27]|uniref:hypothetical protein n=1 Tax=Chitinophaga sp. Hz27 TaxID=3347169 RepID=UPI0035E0C03F
MKTKAQTSETMTSQPSKTKAKKSPLVSNDIRIDARDPIPFKNTGFAYSIVAGAKYLPFLSSGNYSDSLMNDLLEARLLSPTHNRCITSKAKYSSGSGFQHTAGTDLDEKFMDWLKVMNQRREGLTRINRQLFESHYTWGNTPIEVVRYKVAGTPYFCVYIHNAREWRLGTPDDTDIVRYGVQSKLFLHSKGYLSAAQLKNSKTLPIYNPLCSEKDNWYIDENGTQRTLIWYKNDFTGIDYYGLPSAISSMINQVLEYKGARYNLDNFENNMVVSAILALKGNLSQEEADRIGKKVIQTHTGDGKRGRVQVVASEEGITGSELHTMDTTKDGSFIEADHTWQQKIFMANEWDPILCGMLSDSTMGKGAGFLTKVLEQANNTVIRPDQQSCYEDVWFHILTIGKAWMGWNIDPANISIKSNIDISGLTDVDITPAVKRNEVRRAKNLPEDPSPAGDMYLSDLKSQKGGKDVQN